MTERLEKWCNASKAHSLQIICDNGFGAGSWEVRLEGLCEGQDYHNKRLPNIHAVSWVRTDDNEEENRLFPPKTIKPDGSYLLRVRGAEDDDWATLAETLDAALDLAEQLELQSDD